MRVARSHAILAFDSRYLRYLRMRKPAGLSILAAASSLRTIEHSQTCEDMRVFKYAVKPFSMLAEKFTKKAILEELGIEQCSNKA